MKNPTKAISLYKKELHKGKSTFSRAVDYIALRLIAFIACYMWFSTMVTNNTAKILLSIGAAGFISASLDLINTLRLDRFIKKHRKEYKQAEVSKKLLILPESELKDIIRRYIRSNSKDFSKPQLLFTCLRSDELLCDDVLNAIRLCKEKSSTGAAIFYCGKLSDKAQEAAKNCGEVSIRFVNLLSILDEETHKRLSPTDKQADDALVAKHEMRKQQIKKAASAPLEQGRIRRYLFAAASLTGMSFFVEQALYYRLMAAVCICLGAIAWWLNANNGTAVD